MNIRELQEEAHAIAKDHGWRDEERTFGDLIALVLSEALEAYREYGNTTNAWMELVDEDSDDRIPVGVGHELADVVIRVADMAEWYGVDNLATHVQNAVGGPGDQAFGVGLASRELTFGEWVGMAHYWTAEACRTQANLSWVPNGKMTGGASILCGYQ